LTINEPKLLLHVISHTHWDREWYLSFEQFRLLLVDLLDHLIDILESDQEFRFFHLDGQTIVLEDYLELRPQNRFRLTKLIQEGRILIGPWYLQNDEFLTNGESTVRNLLLGFRICREQFSVEPMLVGYLPDQFGNISQMPQILNGFGMGSAVYGRGYEGPQRRPEFVWMSPDGSSVFAVHLFQWYNNAQRLPRDPVTVAAMCREIIEAQSTRIQTSHLLLMNGVDHLEAQENLSTVIREANAASHDFEIRQDTLPNYLSQVMRALPGATVYKGELREGTEGGVLSGTASSRIYLKIFNRRCERLLQRYAEPLALMARSLGCEYRFEDALGYASKLLLQCHPHDSICGCSIDEVHFQMESRFRRVLDVLEEQVKRAMYFLSASIRVPEANVQNVHSVLFVFNPVPFKRNSVFDVTLDMLPHEALGAYEIVDSLGRKVSASIRSSRMVMTQVLNPKRLPKILQTMRYEVTLGDCELEGIGYTAYFLCSKRRGRSYRHSDKQSPSNPSTFAAAGKSVEQKATKQEDAESSSSRVSHAPKKQRPLARYRGMQIADNHPTLENEFVRLDFKPNGAFDLLLKSNGRVFPGCHYFEDCADRGNEYIFMPLQQDEARTTEYLDAELFVLEKSQLCQRIQVKYGWKLPYEVDDKTERRSRKLIGYTITSTFTLRRGAKYIEVATHLENTAKDHRLRVIFPTGIRSNVASADSAFDIVQRPCDMKTEGRNNQQPLESFFSLQDSTGGLSVFSRGTQQYEVIPKGGLMALTLLRCIDILGDLPPQYWKREQLLRDYTPDAQCLRKFTFEYALYPFSGEITVAGVKHECENYLFPPRLQQLPQNRQDWLGTRPGAPPFFDYFEDEFSRIPEPDKTCGSEQSLVIIDNPNVWVSALKFAEAGGGRYVLRVVNSSNEAQSFEIRSQLEITSAEEAMLNEMPLGSLQLRNGDIPDIKIEGKKIMTILLELKPAKSTR
jgi:alpha-mannosidase